MDLPALQIDKPVINPVEQFQAARSNLIQDTSEQMRQRAATMEMLASGAVYAHEGGPSGPVNPAKWNEVLDTFEAAGMPADQLKTFRENPESATILLRGSTAALQAAHDPMLFEMKLAEMQASVDKLNAGPTPTDDEREYARAVQQGFKGTFIEFKKALQSPGTTVNVGPNGEQYGNPGDGLVWQRDKEGKVVIDERGAPIAIPYQGGKAYEAQQAAAASGQVKEDRQNLKAGVVVQDIDRALKQIEEDPFWTTGMGAQATGWIGGSPAKNVSKLIDTVKANAGFEELQAMRESSPTGGALGSVTEREIAYLQSTIGNLEQDQSPEQLMDNMRRVKNAYLDIIHGEGNGPAREKLTFESKADADLTQLSDEELLKQLGQ